MKDLEEKINAIINNLVEINAVLSIIATKLLNEYVEEDSSSLDINQNKTRGYLG